MKQLLYLILPCFLVACSQNQPGGAAKALPSGEEVVGYYNLYAQGDYAAYVAQMASCDGKPEDYRHQMELLLKQHAAQVKREKGGIKAVSFGRMEAHLDSTAVNAFLNVTYQDETTEEVMLPLVLVDNKWRVR